MFVDFKLLDGSLKAIRTDSLLRIRPTVYDYEPESVVMIQYNERQNFSSESLDDLIARFAHHVPLAPLTMLNNTIVHVSAHRVEDVSPPNPVIHNPKSKAIVTLGGDVIQSVLETVPEVQARLNDAMS